MSPRRSSWLQRLADWPWWQMVGMCLLLAAVVAGSLLLDGWRAERWARAWRDAGHVGAPPGGAPR